MELDEVTGGDFGPGFLLGSAVASAVIVASAYGAFDSVVQWKDGKPVGLGVPQ
jgi:hypothetical protein